MGNRVGHEGLVLLRKHVGRVIPGARQAGFGLELEADRLGQRPRTVSQRVSAPSSTPAKRGGRSPCASAGARSRMEATASTVAIHVKGGI